MSGTGLNVTIKLIISVYSLGLLWRVVESKNIGLFCSSCRYLRFSYACIMYVWLQFNIYGVSLAFSTVSFPLVAGLPHKIMFTWFLYNYTELLWLSFNAVRREREGKNVIFSLPELNGLGWSWMLNMNGLINFSSVSFNMLKFECRVNQGV